MLRVFQREPARIPEPAISLIISPSGDGLLPGTIPSRRNRRLLGFGKDQSGGIVI